MSKKLAKIYKVIILEGDTAREVEHRLQSEIEKYSQFEGFEFRHETNIIPIITYENGQQFNNIRYVITFIVKFND